jgi:hypothetical protein
MPNNQDEFDDDVMHFIPTNADSIINLYGYWYHRIRSNHSMLAAYLAILSFKQEGNYTPSVAEIMVRAAISSPTTYSKAVQGLENAGALRRIRRYNSSRVQTYNKWDLPLPPPPTESEIDALFAGLDDPSGTPTSNDGVPPQKMGSSPKNGVPLYNKGNGIQSIPGLRNTESYPVNTDTPISEKNENTENTGTLFVASDAEQASCTARTGPGTGAKGTAAARPSPKAKAVAKSGGFAVDEFVTHFTQKHGRKPTLTTAHCVNLARIAKSMGEENYRACLAGYFASSDAFVVKNNWDASTFVASPDRYLKKSSGSSLIDRYPWMHEVIYGDLPDTPAPPLTKPYNPFEDLEGTI